jgi:hypothetical protein
MNEHDGSGQRSASPLLYIAIFLIVVLAFYGLNHLIMGMQGLPLGLDLTPAQ